MTESAAQKAATKAYRRRMRAQGFVWCGVWIPQQHKQTLREIAAALREGATVRIRHKP